MNPWIILGAVVALIAAGGAGYTTGSKHGKLEQQATDQAQFDDTNAKLTAQKDEANLAYAKFQENNLKLAVERDELKTKLEADREAARIATDNLARKYSSLSLRYNATKAPGCGIGSGAAQGAQPDSPIDAGTSEVQLPDEITRGLRQLVKDADDLADDYRKCYAYAKEVR